MCWFQLQHCLSLTSPENFSKLRAMPWSQLPQHPSIKTRQDGRMVAMCHVFSYWWTLKNGQDEVDIFHWERTRGFSGGKESGDGMCDPKISFHFFLWNSVALNIALRISSRQLGLETTLGCGRDQVFEDSFAENPLMYHDIWFGMIWVN